MEYVVSNELMRELDRYMMAEIGIPGAVLMENAAGAVARAAMERPGRVVVMIGPGNNGGDGLAALRILASHGRSAVGLLLADENAFHGDALLNYQTVKKLALPLTNDLSVIREADIIIDALFGTGLSRPLSGRYLDAVLMSNAANAYRIAVDVPSGIMGSGHTAGECFRANLTVTMLHIKRCLLLTNKLDSVGRIEVARIGSAGEKYREQLEKEQLIDELFVSSLLKDRPRYSNKGSFGRALIAAGSENMPGAAVMAASAAMRAGAGLTRAFVPRAVVPAFAPVPEVMVCPDDDKPFSELLSWASAVGIGCGMGNDPARFEKLKAVLSCSKPAVIDADALNSMDDSLKALLSERHIITPHPGEMSRLTGLSVDEITSDPVAAAADFTSKYGCIVLLKGAVSVIAAPDGRIRYNASGSPGLAKGGSGDVLTGVITSLIAQGLGVFDAACAGSFLLGASAIKAFDLLKERMLAATDVISALGELTFEKKDA